MNHANMTSIQRRNAIESVVKTTTNHTKPTNITVSSYKFVTESMRNIDDGCGTSWNHSEIQTMNLLID